MTLPSLASLADLEARLGATVDKPAERERAVALLADASALVRHEAQEEWLDANDELEDVPPLVVAITCAVALRAFYNPADIASTNMGGVAVQYRDVWLTTSEVARLRGLSPVATLMSVDMEHGYGWGGSGQYFVPVDYGGEPFPIEWP